MATHTLQGPNTKYKNHAAKVSIPAKLARLVLHNPAVNAFRYTDGRLWAPEKDVGHGGIRAVARALGATARGLSETSPKLLTQGTPGSLLEKIHVGVDNAIFKSATDKIAIAIDANWRKLWAEGHTKDGVVEPHYKTTTDRHWIRTHGGAKVDIASIPLGEQPVDVQRETVRGTLAVLGYIADYPQGMPINVRDSNAGRNAAGYYVYNAWHRRNKPGEPLMTEDQYVVSMPPIEKQKDYEQVGIALGVIHSIDGFEGVLERTKERYWAAENHARAGGA